MADGTGRRTSRLIANGSLWGEDEEQRLQQPSIVQRAISLITG